MEILRDLLNTIKTPDQLYQWMSTNLTYHGVPKQVLYTPEDVVKLKKGHCWETAELEYVILTHLGYQCRLVYLQADNCSATHTTLIYEESTKPVWFEWAWHSHKGINRSFSDQTKLLAHIYKLFASEHTHIEAFKIGHSKILPGTTQAAYFNGVRHWRNVQLEQSKSPSQLW